jgi:hypothetical protein
MQPFLAAHLIFEVLDRIGDVAAVTIYASLFQALVEKAASGTNKRLARQILLIARLFSDKDDLGILRTVSEDEMSGVAIEIATPAGFGIASECLERRRIGMIALKRRTGV